MAKIDLKKLNKKQTLILWGAGLIAAIIIFVITIKPRIRQYDAIKKEIGKEEQNIAMAKELISRKQEYENAISRINEKIKYYEAKLPQKKETPKLLDDLARIGTDTKIEHQSIISGDMTSLKAENIDLPYSRWPIAMKLTCGYHQLGNYINQLETGSRFIKVDTLTIDAGQDAFQHQVILNLSTYVVGK